MMTNDDLPDGFKETEIGPIPVDWEVVPLREVTGKTRTRDPRTAPDETFRYIDVSSVSNETYRVQDWKEYQGYEAPSRARKVVKAHDTVFATVRPYLRNIAQVPSHLDNEICSTGFCVIRAKPGKADPDYLFYVALLDAFVARIVAQQRGSSYPAVSDKVVLSELIPLPPLPEQRRIAHVLSTIQRAIAAQDDLITATHEVKRSLMQRLFTYGPGPEPAPTKETEIGEMPEHWEVVRLGEMAEFKNGINFRSDQKGHGILTVDVLNMYAGGIAVQMGNLYRVDTDVKEHYLLQPNDILLVRSSLKQEGVGWPALFTGYTEPVTFCGFLIRARLTSTSVLPEFLVNYLRLPSARQLLVSKSGKVAITNINQGNLGSLRVCLPPLQEQGEIVKALRTVDGKIVAEEQRKAALQALFKAMLYQLMTGQIRMNVEVDFHHTPF